MTDSDVLVSICVPTCNRPELFELSLRACLAQTHDHIEVLIGDDSDNDATQNLIRECYAHDARVRYLRNAPRFGQARNVANLFNQARGSKIVLMHDDDLIEPDAVEAMLALWRIHPDLDIAFGDQYVIDMDGNIDHEASRTGNIAFCRTREAEGLQKTPGRTGLVSMFPNNGWMANADLVRRVNYQERFGVGCDFAFGVQVCLAAQQIYYLHRYVSSYRLTNGSTSQTTAVSMHSAAVEAYKIARELEIGPELESARRIAYKRMVPIIVSTLSRNRQPLNGLKLALTHLHAYNYGLSARFYYHLLLIGRSFLSHA
ncbi:MAG TPA: glycosyltransferase family 2 protein [Pararobbsia sp.]|nr:glycosyltransferase family 2 protein [Pararobbsia sp.]